MKRKLATSGDQFEKKWEGEIVPLVPEYEEFWNDHVVPLTFRDAEEPNRSKYLRPGLKGVFIDYADTSYAAFFHLAFCFHWLDQIRSHSTEKPYDTNAALWGSESVYCFYSHAISAHDAAANFCRSVNRVADYCSSCRVFDVEDDPRKPLFVFGLEGGERLDDLCSLVEEIRSYRNIVVHERIVFLQNGYLPSPERLPKRHEKDKRWQKAGLAVIGLFARDYDKWKSDRSFELEFVKACDLVEEQLLEMCARLRPIWRHAKSAFDELDRTEPKFRRRVKIDPKDRTLSQERFNRARSLGR